MEAKILTYRADGNGIKRIAKDLIKVVENVYYYESGDDFMIVFCYHGVLFEVERAYELNRVLSLTESMYDNWIRKNLSDEAVLNPDHYTRNLEIEVLRQSGKDEQFSTAVLENKRVYIAKQEEIERLKRERRAEADAEKARIKEEAHRKEVEKAESDWKSGESISPELFLSLCLNTGVIVQPKTKGRLLDERKTARCYNRGVYQYTPKKGRKLAYFTGYYTAMDELNKNYGM